VEKSYKEAARWFEASAKQGNADAMFNLGVCYSIGGYGLSKSYIKAFDCFRKAAEQGHADAKFMLALCYYDGEGTAQSYDDAVVLLKELAMDGHAEGQFFLGLCYEHGHGVKQSDIEAGKWYIKARSNGSADAEEALEKLKRKQYGNDASVDILEQIVGSFVN
jgi:TPR repeat protein